MRCNPHKTVCPTVRLPETRMNTEIYKISNNIAKTPNGHQKTVSVYMSVYAVKRMNTVLAQIMPKNQTDKHTNLNGHGHPPLGGVLSCPFRNFSVHLNLGKGFSHPIRKSKMR